MNKDVAKSQAETLMVWADQWGRDESSGSREVSFLLARASRLMSGLPPEVSQTPFDMSLPSAPVHSEVASD